MEMHEWDVIYSSIYVRRLHTKNVLGIAGDRNKRQPTRDRRHDRQLSLSIMCSSRMKRGRKIRLHVDRIHLQRASEI